MSVIDVVEDQADPAQGSECWCCGSEKGAAQMLHLGNHPEANVCLDCAHFLHKRANGLEDDMRSGLAPRVRDVFRSGRRLVVQRGWHRNGAVGRVFRWVGRYLP